MFYTRLLPLAAAVDEPPQETILIVTTVTRLYAEYECTARTPILMESRPPSGRGFHCQHRGGDAIVDRIPFAEGNLRGAG